MTAVRLLHGVLAACLALPAGAGERLAQTDQSYSLRADIRRLKDRVEALESETRTLRARIADLQRARKAAMTPRIVEDGRARDGEALSPPVVFVVSADPRAGPRSMALDGAEIARRCADENGCLATLAIAGFEVDDRPFEVAVGHGPCLLHLDADSGVWSVAAGCAAGPDTPGPLGLHGLASST